MTGRHKRMKIVKAYFESRDGEIIYPSDVVEALGMDYDQAKDAIEDLWCAGLIRVVDPRHGGDGK